VAATPETVKNFVKEGHTVFIEKSAGENANLADSLYE